MSDAPVITDNPGNSRFEYAQDGHLAVLTYHRSGKRLVLLHTGTPHELEGHGIGGALVQAALDRARREGLTVVPKCPFARGWLERHPEAAEGVALDPAAG
jgi:predicted GNAT family acetyltransferase